MATIRCCGLASSHGLVLHIGITSSHLSPLDKNVRKKNYYIKLFMTHSVTQVFPRFAFTLRFDWFTVLSVLFVFTLIGFTTVN